MISIFRNAVRLLFAALGLAFLVGGPAVGAARGWSAPTVAASVAIGAASLLVAVAMLRRPGDA